MEYLKSLFDRALDAVVGMDDAGKVTAWNTAAEDMFGWGREEAMGKVMADLIVPLQYRTAHARGLEHYLLTGEGPALERRIRISAINRDRSEFPVELSIFAMKDGDKAPHFYAFIRSLIAEESARRDQELRVIEAEAVMKIGQKLIEDVSLDEFIQFCLRTVSEIAGMDAAHLWFVRGSGQAQILVPSGVWYLRNCTFQPIAEQTDSIRFERGQGLPGRAWLTGELEARDELVSDGNFFRRQVFSQVGLTRGVALPVKHGNAIHAVLEFYGTETSRLDPDILRLLKTAGTQLGIAIRRKTELNNKETLRREMVHRLGNSLTVLSSIYRSCSRSSSTKEELDEAFLGRVMAMGMANQMAITEAERGVTLAQLIDNALAIIPDQTCFQIDAPSVFIDSELVMPLSLVLNELSTNALKYGALGIESNLTLSVSINKDPGELTISWCEQRYKPQSLLPLEPSREGFGTKLLKAMIEERLGGSYERRLDGTGFIFSMKMPWCSAKELTGE